ncbi:hypothetical protein BKA70DRAFT_1369758 [Coprinopsis sp. MPI-PUGE-AT-0042]|nr:hypothetical protein BKA70DRAFT_1369758 [Coprinopsis sp. MPI-PUGE-AT-0042]
MTFPSPVGGVGFPSDFAPSIIFAVLYGLLLPLLVYRFWDRRSRTYLISGTVLFTVERIVSFSFRALQAQRLGWRTSRRLAIYHQSSFGLSFISISADMVNLLQCLLVHPTYGYERYPESCAAATKDCALQPPAVGEEDRLEARRNVRRRLWFFWLAFFAASVPGMVAAWSYRGAMRNPDTAYRVFKLRYASSAVALFLTLIIAAAAVLSLLKQRRTGRSGVMILLTLTTLTSIVAIYRLAVMHNYTEALDSTGRGSLNSPGDKAAFYVLHVLPEWISNVIILGFNVRRSLGLAHGEDRGREENAKERAKREKRLRSVLQGI